MQTREFKEGREAHKIGDFATALLSFRRACELTPQCSTLWILRGSSALEIDLFEEAKSCFEEAVRLDADSAIAFRFLGNACDELGQFEEAIEAYLQALYIKREATVLIFLGDVYRNMERDADAEDCFREAIEVEPHNEEAHVNLAIVLREANKDFKTAIEHLEIAIDIDPDYFLAHHEMGINLRHVGEWDEAVQSFERALRLNKNCFWTLCYLGAAYFADEQWSRAEDYYLQAHKVEPKCYLPVKFLFQTYEAMGNKEEARLWRLLWKSLQPEDA